MALWDEVGRWWGDLFKPLDENKRREVLNPGQGVPKSIRPEMEPRFYDQHPNLDRPKQAVSNGGFKWPAGELSVGNYDAQKQQAFGQVPDDMYAAQKARMNPRLNPPMEEPQQGPSLMEQILDRLDDPYGGFKGNVDTSALDAALKSRLSAIGGVRNTTNQNFDISDQNLQSMHNAFKRDVETTGKAEFNDISNDQIAALTANRNEGVNQLQGLKNEENAKRMAMLKNLGIEASAATPTDTSAYDQGISSISSRGQAENANAIGDRATNLAYNQTLANSIGQQGVERRSDLTQQLQSILGQLGMAESEAQGQYAQGKAQMQQQAADRDYQMWNQNRQFDQSRYNDLFGQSQQLEERDYQRQQDLIKMAQQAPPKTFGFGGLAQDLVNTGYGQDESQRAMQILSQVLVSPEMQTIPTEADRTAYVAQLLKRGGVNDVMAAQLATNYRNLGSTSSY